MNELPAGFTVSRETQQRLEIFVDELRRWQPTLNLISTRSLQEVWTRHVADALQLADLKPGMQVWLDLGSGGGVPGLVIAATDPALHMTLVESDVRKCAFLRSVSARMGLSTRVLATRIEHVANDVVDVDVVTARGLAPLAELLGYARPWLMRGAVGLFPKGKAFSAELTAARECWTFRVDIVPSRTDPSARILRVTDLWSRTPDGREDDR